MQKQHSTGACFNFLASIINTSLNKTNNLQRTIMKNIYITLIHTCSIYVVYQNRGGVLYNTLKIYGWGSIPQHACVLGHPVTTALTICHTVNFHNKTTVCVPHITLSRNSEAASVLSQKDRPKEQSWGLDGHVVMTLAFFGRLGNLGEYIHRCVFITREVICEKIAGCKLRGTQLLPRSAEGR